MTDEARLIFIISQPRSGSTLLQKLISNNSLTETVSEPWLLLPLLSIYKPSLVEAKYNYPVALQGFFDYLEKKNAKEELRESMRRLVLDLYKVKDKDHFFIDKTPRYYEILPEIRDLFPNAKFLVLKRNLFASLHSMITTWAGGKVEYDKFSTFYRDFLSAPFLIQEFCKANAANPNVMTVKYEDIVGSPATSVQGIYSWLGIPFDESVLAIGKNEKVKGIFGDDVYKKQPLAEINSALSETWKEGLSNKELANFYAGYQAYLSGDFIREYGYREEQFPTSFLGKGKFEKYVQALKSSNAI